MKKTILLLPVLAGIMFGAAGVFVRNLTAYGMTNPTIIFLRTSIAAIELLLLILFTNKSLLRIRLSDFFLFLINGLCSMIGLTLCLSVLPYVFITTALKHAEAGLVSIFASGSEPIAALFFGMIFYHEIPSFMAFCGMLVTITALVILCRGTKEAET